MYYLIEIAKGDTKITGAGVYKYDTLNNATAAFHSKLGTAMKSDLFESELILIIDDEGKVYKRELYNAPAVKEEQEINTITEE